MAEQSEQSEQSDRSEQSERRAVVVGTDGSDLSIRAIRWAADHAKLIGTDLLVVTGYEDPWTIMFVPTYTEADYAREAHQVLDASVATALGATPPVAVEKRLVHRRPAHALTEAAVGAPLLVVGSHGKGEIPGMHLGSVATYCVHHAPCPVLVYRHSAD